jgi:hypothetical protein
VRIIAGNRDLSRTTPLDDTMQMSGQFVTPKSRKLRR